MKQIISIVLLCLLLSSCATRRYSDSAASATLINQLSEEISGFEDYIEYSREELGYILPSDMINSDICVLYSKDTDDQGEIGVIRAKTEKDAKEIAVQITEYIKSSKEERRAFLENYLPNELSKLNSAQVRRFGCYVIYTILESDQASVLFNAAQKRLTTP